MSAGEPERPLLPVLEEVYARLLRHHGPQHWWPAESHYEMITGAILTQNTAWANVVRALDSLRQADIWSFAAVLATPQDELGALIRPTGYFNQKARKLHAFARCLADEFGGSIDRLFELEAAGLRARLLGIWGIGEETADDIIVYAAGKPSFVIDAYTVRLAGRLGWDAGGGAYSDYQRMFTSQLAPDAALYGEYHALIDRHCHTICKKTPLCADCCLLDICPAASGFMSGVTTAKVGDSPGR